MITQEFKNAVIQRNLLRTRIMLKDSLVVDPTLRQFDEMFSYAKAKIPEIIVPFDGDSFEEDSSKWTQETMNMELVQLVSNFSNIRIEHLKKVVSKVLAKTARAASPNSRPSHSSRDMIRVVKSETGKINKILYEVKENQTLKKSHVDEIEASSKEILRAIRRFKENR